MSQDFVVAIRTSGERTFKLCDHLVQCLIGNQKVYVINSIPFETTLRKCYEIGVKSDAKWMITLDADVLLMPQAINTLLHAAENMPTHYVQLEGRVFDKILGTYRQAGHRIYRTSLLSKALDFIPQSGTQIRPEYYTLQQLGQQGHPSRRIGAVLGLHDYEQYFADLYRKALVHAVKHRNHLPHLINRCANLQSDNDFKVILKGIFDGLTLQQNISIDRDKYTQLAALALTSLGLSEKAPIANATAMVAQYETTFDELRNSQPPPDFPTIDLLGSAPPESGYAWQQKLKQRMNERGLFKGSISTAGVLLIKAGQYLERIR